MKMRRSKLKIGDQSRKHANERKKLVKKNLKVH